MNTANFIVRPEREAVERFQTPDAWQRLDDDALGVLAHHVAGLPSETEPDDITARLFDLTCLNLQIATLDKAETQRKKLIDRIAALAAGLEAAREAFSDFIANQQLDSRQIRFVDMIIEHLTMNGTMQPGQLYEAPFNGLHYEGIDGIFPADNADKVIRIVRAVNSNAHGVAQVA